MLAFVGILILAFAKGQPEWAMTLAKAGIFLFAGATVFTVITIPVELNASRRALLMLESSGYITERERPHVKKVLDAAALTYLAAAFMSVMMLVRLILLLTMVSRRD